MAYLNLPAALARRGLTVETVPGWETRSNGYDLRARGAICHWTAGPRGSTTRPSLNVVLKGRPDLPGPLCNVYLDRTGIAVVCSARAANHAGAGTWRGVSGNSALFGTEAECGGPGDWTDAQRRAYPRVNAAYCDLGGFGADMIAGHHEYATPPGRKSDPHDWPMPAMRAQVAALLSGAPTAGPTLDEDAMTPEQSQRAMNILERLLAEHMGPFDPKTGRSLENGHEVVNNEEGTPVRRTLLQMVSESWRENTFRMKSRVPGADYRGTVLDYACNADRYGFNILEQVQTMAAGKGVAVEVDSVEVADVLAAIPSFVDALADALAPKLAALLKAKP